MMHLSSPRQCIFPLVVLLLSLLGLSMAQGADSIGYLEPGRSIRVSSAEPGIVKEVLVKEGAQVKSNDVLVRLDTRVLELEAKIIAEEYSVMKRRLEKLREILPKKFASEDEILRAESDSLITGLRKERIEAQIERLTLRSPIDGVVTELRFDEAEGVGASNSHVATVVQLQPMRVQFNLPLEQARHLSQGAEVLVEFPDYGETRVGVVDYISPVSTAVVNTIRTRIMIPNPGKLPAGIKCRLQADASDQTQTPQTTQHSLKLSYPNP